ncbi:MAG: nucleotidyltransferase domain-containing protein [Epsilonproteobacteria bacterium]|nr:MAG: nucleotidyltransferase domain-containing protein [Campylobacterota bacterium]RLA63098.1 MAG: nucleotidyltransferase domain-containing protein [Campylobacterota bacterium]
MIEKELLEFIIERIKKYFPRNNIKLYLYGSRARGDFNQRSDYDLAFQLPQDFPDAEFLMDIKDNAPTLCGIDAVNLNDVGDELRQTILKEGKLIYES